MIFFSDRKTAFRSADLRQAAGDVPNPGRGWYRIYTYTIGEGQSCDLPPVLYETETLALVLIDIGAYRERPLEEEGLSLIDKILDCFAAGGKDIILRIAYDTQGKGLEREPSLFSKVQLHVRQLAPLLIRHSRHILVFQGLLIGSWGEMHTSKFVTEKYLCELSQSFLFETEGKVRFAVRKPVQFRMIQAPNDMDGTLAGCFDDAIFASDTHMGTFGTQDSGKAGWIRPWRPEEEIAFLRKLAVRVPFGGEVLSGEDMTPPDTLKRLRMLCVSYLNCVHEEARLRKWKEMEYSSGVSLYDTIGACLGYRLSAETVSFEKKGRESCLKLKITNHGFACCGEAVRFDLSAGGQSGDRRISSLDCGLGKLEGGESLTLRIPLEPEQCTKGTCFYGELRRVRDESLIRFANEPAGERLLLGGIN